MQPPEQVAIIGGQNNKYVFFHRICLKVEEKTGKNWASSNIYTFCKGGQVPKINDVLVRRFDHWWDSFGQDAKKIG